MKFFHLCLAGMIAYSCFGNAVCHKCEEIRAENAKKVNKYEYYEDYLKDHPNGDQPQQQSEEKNQNLRQQNQNRQTR